MDEMEEMEEDVVILSVNMLGEVVVMEVSDGRDWIINEEDYE